MTIKYNRLQAECAAIEGRGRDFTMRVARRIRDHAAENSPVRTGYLKSRNQVEVRGDTAIAYNDADYAEAVNNGHTGPGGAHVPANPFFSLAVSQTQAEMPALIAESFK